MFAIGDSEWPGISKLVEEAAEVGQVCGKLMGSRGEIKHWDGSNLFCRLEDELGDLLAAINFVAKENGLDLDRMNARMEEKVALFNKWHAEDKTKCACCLGPFGTVDMQTKSLCPLCFEGSDLCEQAK